MIRTKTTLVVGAGAATELQMPDGPALLSRIAASLDFARLGTGLENDDMLAMAKHIEEVAEQARVKKQDLMEAGQAIRSAARLSSSIDAVLQQLGDNPMALAVGKLAITHFTLAAEAQSPLLAEPRDPGDLPVRGAENWLFQLSRAIVDGVPRTQAERCLDNLSVISFNYDRSLEIYLPWAFNLAFGMSIVEAQDLVAEKLRLLHVYGAPGRLEWQSRGVAVADWAATQVDELPGVVEQIRIHGERLDEKGFKRRLFGELIFGKRLFFLGFDFDPMKCALLFDAPFDHNPDVYVSCSNSNTVLKSSISGLLRSLPKVKADAITVAEMPSWQMLRDYSLLFES